MAKTKMSVENGLEEEEIVDALVESVQQEPVAPAETEEKKPIKKISSLPANPEHLRVVEAALFLVNKPLSFKEISEVAKCKPTDVEDLLELLKQEYESRNGAVELVVQQETASLQVRPDYLGHVSKLSKEIEVSRKGLKILALIAKKKEMLQKDLKHYFKGEIYAYVTELKNLEYITSERKGNTRLLKPTKKFLESFQVGQ
jgi:chromosome segregation and condensation protein ScpB